MDRFYFQLLVVFLLHRQLLAFPMREPHFSSSSARSARNSETASALLSVSFVINSISSGICHGGNRTGLCSTDIRLEYRDNAFNSSYQWAEVVGDIRTDAGAVNATVSTDSECVWFRLVQEEHGGGACNCWMVSDVRVNNVSVVLEEESVGAEVEFCGDSASLPREIQWTNGGNSCVMNEADPLEKPFSTSCLQSEPRINASFHLLYPEVCNTINEFYEGVEFSIRLGMERVWIPILYTFVSEEIINEEKRVGEFSGDELKIRGYVVEQQRFTVGSRTRYSVQICDFNDGLDSVQFRWLHTSRFDDRDLFKDVWSLDDILVTYEPEEGVETILLEDSFNGDQLNVTNWYPNDLRNGDLSATCTGKVPNQSLVFSLGSPGIGGTASRGIKSRKITFDPPHTTTESPTTMTTTPDASTTLQEIRVATSDSILTTISTTSTTGQVINEGALQTEVDTISGIIMNDPVLNGILMAEPLEAIDTIVDLVTPGTPEDVPSEAAVVVFLLGDVLGEYNLTDSEDQEQFIEGFLTVGDQLTRQENGEDTEVEQAVVGSSFLAVMDRLALQVLPETSNRTVGNLNVQTQLLAETDGENYVTAINSSPTPAFPEMSIELPAELLTMAISGREPSGTIRAVSFLYHNAENLFPNGSQNNTELGSGIVSTALQCGDERCPTEDLNLRTPVRITIHHSEMVEAMITNDANKVTQCMFWEFLEEREQILSTGRWSDRGCSKNVSLSNTSVTVCECNHLTHFAILLSANPPNFSDSVVLSLEIIGYVGVSISLVAMALTIATFIIMKSLHNMRTYIHINLCISLGIAQLTFVAGIDQSADDQVPIHCQVIAVLLHYFFLVSFMWMLMEGVVLYVILIKVFVSNTKRYMFAFTIASYGLPLLYLGLLTLPLGFALPTQPNYGYTVACFLNPGTNFIWAFIAPVIAIILANIAFFVMAAVVMWKHRKRQRGEMNIKQVKSWLKASASLIVVLGVPWIFGVLLVEVEELTPLAYIYTVLVAFQGVWIFLIFVVFPKQVRDNYSKLGRSSKSRESRNTMTSNFSSNDTLTQNRPGGASRYTAKRDSSRSSASRLDNSTLELEKMERKETEVINCTQSINSLDSKSYS